MIVDAGSTLDAVIEAYTQHSRRVRGLRDRTLRSYADVSRLFVRATLGDDPVDPRRLSPADVMTVCRLVERPVLSPLDEDGPVQRCARSCDSSGSKAFATSDSRPRFRQ